MAKPSLFTAYFTLNKLMAVNNISLRMDTTAKNQEEVNDWCNIGCCESRKVTTVKIGEDGFLNYIDNIDPIAKFSCLEKTHIANVNMTSFDVLKKCPNLIIVSLVKCPNITSFNFLHFLPNLEQLTLSQLNIAIFDLSASNTKLKQLSLYECGELLLVTGIQHCSQLEDISYCKTKIQDISNIVAMQNLIRIDFTQTLLPKEFQTCLTQKDQTNAVLELWKQTLQYHVYMKHHKPMLDAIGSVHNSINNEIHLTKDLLATSLNETQQSIKELSDKVDLMEVKMNKKIDEQTNKIDKILDLCQQIFEACLPNNNQK